MISHLSLAVSDLARARAFYEAALAPLGYRVRLDLGGGIGFGRGDGITADDDPGGAFWISAGGDPNDAAARAAGGGDNGGPGLRTHYHPNYYAAFVTDPDGWRIEAVCHRADG